MNVVMECTKKMRILRAGPVHVIVVELAKYCMPSRIPYTGTTIAVCETGREEMSVVQAKRSVFYEEKK